MYDCLHNYYENSAICHWLLSQNVRGNARQGRKASVTSPLKSLVRDFHWEVYSPFLNLHLQQGEDRYHEGTRLTFGKWFVENFSRPTFEGGPFLPTLNHGDIIRWMQKVHCDCVYSIPFLAVRKCLGKDSQPAHPWSQGKVTTQLE